MKVKADFVTNSSSSSYVAYGCNMTEEDIRKAVDKYGEDYKYDGDLSWFGYDAEEEFAGVHPIDILRDVLGDDNFDEKVKQLAADIINEKLGTNKLAKDISYVEEVVYDG